MWGWARTLCGAMAGALTGFGLIALMSVGLPFLLVGIAMALVGLLWLLVNVVLALIGPLRHLDSPREFLGGLARRMHGVWTFLVALGGLPALVLSSSLLERAARENWSCSRVTFGAQGAEVYGYGSSSGESVVCDAIPGELIVMTAVFCVVALLGVVLLLLARGLRSSTNAVGG